MRGHREILAMKLAIFDPCFVQISGDRAENLSTVSPLQLQHMLQISAHLYFPEMRSIFEGDGGAFIDYFCSI